VENSRECGKVFHIPSPVGLEKMWKCGKLFHRGLATKTHEINFSILTKI
jgi:hypothetical protein